MTKPQTEFMVRLFTITISFVLAITALPLIAKGSPETDYGATKSTQEDKTKTTFSEITGKYSVGDKLSAKDAEFIRTHAQALDENSNTETAALGQTSNFNKTKKNMAQP